MASIKKAEDYYRTSLIWAFLGQKEEAEKFYALTMKACNGFPPIISSAGTFKGCLFLRMAVLRKALNKYKKTNSLE